MDRGAWQATVYGIAELDMTEQLNWLMAALVRRTRGGQRGQGGDAAPVIYQAGEWVRPIFCHLFLLTWSHLARKCNQLLTPRHRRGEIRVWSRKTASETLNLVGVSVALLLRMRHEESLNLVLWQPVTWRTLVSSPQPATYRSYSYPMGFLEKYAMRPTKVSGFFIQPDFYSSLKPNDVLSHQPHTRKLERHELLGW